MSAFLEGARFELRAAWRFRNALLILLGAATFYAFLYPAPYATQVFREMPVYALDRDGSALGREVLARIDASPDVRIMVASGDPLAARRALAAGEVFGIVEIPDAFQRDALRGRSPAVGVFANAGYLLGYSELATAASAAVLETGVALGIAAQAGSGRGAEAMLARQQPIGLELVRLYDPGGGYASFVVPGVLIVILQQTMLVGLSLLCEARREVPERPVRGIGSRAMHELGRAAPWVAIHLVQLAVILGGIFPLYGLPVAGSAWRVLPFMALFFLAVALSGLLVAQAFRRAGDVIPVLLFTSLPIVFLSGFSWPQESIPEPLHMLARLIPATSGVEGFVRLNQRGTGLDAVLVPGATLAALATVALAVLVVLAGRRRS